MRGQGEPHRQRERAGGDKEAGVAARPLGGLPRLGQIQPGQALEFSFFNRLYIKI
jgi:hypothetical protein